MSAGETNGNDLRLFDILRQRGLLSPSMQTVVAGFMAKWGMDAFRAVIETHIVEESQIADILADKFGFPRLTRVKILNVPVETLSLVPYNLALDLAVFPFEMNESQRLHVVFANPSNPEYILRLEVLTGKKIEPFVGELSEIIAAIQRHYPLELQLPSLLSGFGETKGVPS
jgi:Type II secretion system (T2SS), protein E, N-terminal domain